jgi:Flp pilus assembly protein TadD
MEVSVPYRIVPRALPVAALLCAAVSAAQERPALLELARSAASVVQVVVRDDAGASAESGVGVFTDIGRLVVPRTLLLQGGGEAAIVFGGHDHRITAVLADDPRSGLALVAVDLPDGAPSAIRSRTERAVLPAGSYRALADDGTAVRVEVGAEQDLAGVGAVSRVTSTGPMPASGSPVVDSRGEMVGILLERSAIDAKLTVLVPSLRVLTLPAIPPSSLAVWQRGAQGARPADAEAAFLRGLDASLGGRPAEAADGFREAAARHAADADAHAALAASELAAGHRDAAFAAYRRAIEAAPNDPRFHHDLGVALSDADRWEDAAREFADVARLRPADPEAHFNAGTAYGHLGRLDEEYRAYQAALEQNPAHVNALRNLGIACIALKRYAEAVTATARALRFRPSDARLHAQLGVAYFDMKDYPAAIVELTRATTIEPDFVQAHYGLAVAYAASGQHDAAQRACDKLKSLDPARGAEVARLLR